MNTPPGPVSDPAADARAARRFAVLNAVRFGSLFAVMAGIAGAQNVLPIPYILAVALAVAGVVGFFFGPPLLARRFKASDNLNESEQDA